MTWNYRIIEYDAPDSYFDIGCCALHEILYDEFGKVKSWTEKPCSVVADNAEGLPSLLNNVALAFTQPSLKMSELNKIVPE